MASLGMEVFFRVVATDNHASVGGPIAMHACTTQIGLCGLHINKKKGMKLEGRCEGIQEELKGERESNMMEIHYVHVRNSREQI